MTQIIIAPQVQTNRPSKNKRTKSRCITLVSYTLLPLICLLLVGIVLLAVLLPSETGTSSPTGNVSNVYAVLVAGSRGFHNYRHQADVALVYHLLLEKGVPQNNIITMMFDDIAHNPENPYPGELRSSPMGPNLYKNLRIDYRGNDVNVNVLMGVLSGNSAAVINRGTSRVLNNLEEKNIFLYYTDHGDGGILGMPTGEYLTKRKFQHVISKVQCNAIAIYIEACQAAKMVAGYEDSPKIFALVASAPWQSSYATNCRLGICYSDAFTLAWTRDSKTHNIRHHSLGNQSNNVRESVTLSTVTSFGNEILKRDQVQSYQGGSSFFWWDSNNNTSNGLRNNSSILVESLMNDTDLSSIISVDIPIYSAQWKVKNAKTKAERLQAQDELDTIISGRLKAERLITSITHDLNATFPTNELEIDEDSECFEKILETFSDKCFKLGTNTYFTGIITRIKKYIIDDNCESILDIISNECGELEKTNGNFII